MNYKKDNSPRIHSYLAGKLLPWYVPYPSREHGMKWVVLLEGGYQRPLPWECIQISDEKTGYILGDGFQWPLQWECIQISDEKTGYPWSFRLPNCSYPHPELSGCITYSCNTGGCKLLCSNIHHDRSCWEPTHCIKYKRQWCRIYHI